MGNCRPLLLCTRVYFLVFVTDQPLHRFNLHCVYQMTCFFRKCTKLGKWSRSSNYEPLERLFIVGSKASYILLCIYSNT